MTKKGSFIPRRRDKVRTKGKEFIDELKNDGTDFDISDEKITQAETLFDDFDDNLSESEKINEQKEAQTKNTQSSLKSFKGIWRDIAAKIKVHDNYNEIVGERYGIIGDEISIDPDTSLPELKIKSVPSGWELIFNLQNFFSGVNIYRKRPDDTDFRFLATDTRSPYIDTDPMEPGTQYYAYYIEGDEEVGLKSSIVTIDV